MNTVLLVHSEAALVALPRARRLAARSGQVLVVLCFCPDPVLRLDSVQEPGEGAPELLVQRFEALRGDPGPGVEVVDCRGPRPRKAPFPLRPA